MTALVPDKAGELAEMRRRELGREFLVQVVSSVENEDGPEITFYSSERVTHRRLGHRRASQLQCSGRRRDAAEPVRWRRAVTEPDPIRSVHIDDIEYTDDLFVVYEGEPYTGQVCDYYMDGHLYKIETYGNGRRRGLERSIHPDGSIESEYWNVDGARHGIGRTWYPNGQLESETQYDHARVLSRKRWSEDGTELS